VHCLAWTNAFFATQDVTLQSDKIGVRDVNKMPPLLQRLSERRPEQLDYLGVSYGLTKDLLRFWKRSGYVPLYIRQTANDLTGEHTCVMLKTLHSEVAGSAGWLSAFAQGQQILTSCYSLQLIRECSGRLPTEVLVAAFVQVQGV
jgi:N-acetyltransferase 10